ncbi:MAG TPA: hypothetical protein PJ982_00120 [Lacipirellulaceae bacterium]|nr:hypothetical protein [Lacipirellulaceae bacterium]
MISRERRSKRADLATAIDALREEVRVLRDVLDELRDALQWQNNNAREFPALVENRGTTCSLANATLPPPPASAEPQQALPPAEHTAQTKQRDLF